VGSVRYCTRDDVMRAAALVETQRLSAATDRAIDAASRNVEALCHRRFYPTKATRTLRTSFAYTATDLGAWREYLTEDFELLYLNALTLDDATIADWWLGPQDPDTDAGRAPYTYLDLETTGSVLELTGTFGGCWATRAVTALDASALIGDTTLAVADSSQVGVGATIKVGLEWLTVERTALAATGQTLLVALDQDVADNALSVASPTLLHPGEMLTVDAERMLVEDVTATTVIVERASAGSALAAHTTSTAVYAPRTLTVDRAQLGSTATAHSDETTVYRLAPPSLVVDLVIGEALDTLAQESSSYARTIGAAEFARTATGRGLAGLRKLVRDAHGRGLRTRAI
jgi:hypothetical protein